MILKNIWLGIEDLPNGDHRIIASSNDFDICNDMTRDHRLDPNNKYFIRTLDFYENTRHQVDSASRD